MSLLYLGIIIFLFALAICDLSIGVANDAVNFLSPAVGAKAAAFKVILLVAAVGILVGTSTSSGMMEIARNGIMNPSHYFFEEVICIFLAVSATDVILMDVFNTLGMPTSTTVSMVFGLLGGSSAIAFSKILSSDYSYAALINTDKALQVIIAIFLSVAIAFIVGTVVMWLTRTIFTFNYKKHSRYSIALFGGVAFTSILYFLLVSGLKNSNLLKDFGITPDWIDANRSTVLWVCFACTSVIMEILHLCKVNIFKIVVLFGTFSLAMAFASNDLVNFIGVPLAGLESFLDFTNNAGGALPSSYKMTMLSSASTNPLFVSMKPWFLIGAGVIMATAISLSKKARKVIYTNNSLAAQKQTEEVFSSSKLARTLVRGVLNFNSTMSAFIPKSFNRWVDSRFNSKETTLPEGATFDLVRASVNLVLAGFLIVVGTSLQLPLSTTYVAFMVGMGTSLADRAWGRETAVYRITGVITVIGGWFVTAGAAFMLSFLIATLNHWGGVIGMVVVMLIIIAVLIRNNKAFKKKEESEDIDVLFRQLVKSTDKTETWHLLEEHVVQSQVEFLRVIRSVFNNTTQGVMDENIRQLRQAVNDINAEKRKWKRYRSKEVVGMRRIDYLMAVEKNTWFHLASNNMTQIIYSLKRMLEPAVEHVDNNFTPLPKIDLDEFRPVCKEVDHLLSGAERMISTNNYKGAAKLLVDGNALKKKLSVLRHLQQEHLQHEEQNIRASLLYLNLLQETQELISMTRHLLRASKRFRQ